MNEQDPIKRIQAISPNADIPLAGESRGFAVKVTTPAEFQQG
jgi:hypothetical protein